MDAGKLQTFRNLYAVAAQLLRPQEQSTPDILRFSSDLHTFLSGFDRHDKTAFSFVEETKKGLPALVTAALEILVREGKKARVGTRPEPGIRDEWTMEVIRLAQGVAKVGFVHGDFIEAYRAKHIEPDPSLKQIVDILNAG